MTIRPAPVPHTPVDPVCAFHGLRESEHVGGRCLFCCICFETLTPEGCWQDEHGQKWDMCVPCGVSESQGPAEPF